MIDVLLDSFARIKYTKHSLWQNIKFMAFIMITWIEFTTAFVTPSLYLFSIYDAI